VNVVGELKRTAAASRYFLATARLGGVGIFKVFIEYPENLGSGCISMFSVNLTFHKTL